MKRIDNWETALADFIHARLRKPFAWGDQDCAQFACDAVRVITGEDLAADFRGKYSDARGALGAIKEYAGGGLEALVEKKAAEHKLSEVHINLAGRGDVVLFDAGDGSEALGVVAMDGRTAVSAGETGLRFVPPRNWRKAWKI